MPVQTGMPNWHQCTGANSHVLTSRADFDVLQGPFGQQNNDNMQISGLTGTPEAGNIT